MYGAYLFINGFELLNIKADGLYTLADIGHAFLKGEIPTLQALDDAEGMLRLLSILATKKMPNEVICCRSGRSSCRSFQISLHLEHSKILSVGA